MKPMLGGVTLHSRFGGQSDKDFDDSTAARFLAHLVAIDQACSIDDRPSKGASEILGYNGAGYPT